MGRQMNCQVNKMPVKWECSKEATHKVYPYQETDERWELCHDCAKKMGFCLKCGELDEDLVRGQDQYGDGLCWGCHHELAEQERYTEEMAEQGYDEQGRAIEEDLSPDWEEMDEYPESYNWHSDDRLEDL